MRLCYLGIGIDPTEQLPANYYLDNTWLQITGYHQANTTTSSSVFADFNKYRATNCGISLVVASYLQSGII